MFFRVSPVVTAAMERTPRTWFLPPEARDLADVDAPLGIGKGQTSSQPTTVAIMLDLLEVQRGDKVLDVGAGSGWTTAILANLVGTGGKVIGVERHESLMLGATSALAEYLESEQSAGRAGDLGAFEVRLAQKGVLGIPEEAPFQRILVSAMAAELPQGLVDQLGEGGIMVIPVAGTMLRVAKSRGHTIVSKHGLFSFVPLVQD